MSSNIGKKNIAHKGSGHGVVGPPAVSLVTPPAPPAPTPFVYSAQASNAKKTKKKYVVAGNEVLAKGSTMSLDPPANQPAQSGGGDVVTHATKNVAVMTMGSASLVVAGKEVCATGDMAALNVITDASSVAQVQMPLLEAGDFEAARAAAAAAAAELVKKWRAFPPQKAEQCRGGHPVDLGTGYVVDDAVDLSLHGFLPLVWSRSYSSAQPSRRGALGKGGWVHSFEQWIEVREGAFRLYDEEGCPVDFPPLGPDGVSFHRKGRFELTRRGRAFEIRGLRDRLTRTFAPLPNGRIALRSIKDTRGHEVQLEYKDNILVRILDSVKRELRISNNAMGRVTRVEVWASEPGSERAPSLQTWFDYAYHPEGELASHTNVLSHAESWEYDGLHRMTKATLRNGVSFYYEYHPEIGYCVHTWGDGGIHDIRIDIDFEKEETLTHGTNLARRYLWKNGIVRREETFDGNWAAERLYDDDEILIGVRNGVGEGPNFQYDARGNLVGGTDAAGNEYAWEYDDDIPVRFIGPTGLERLYVHDAHAALVEIAFPTGESYRFELDREGRVAAVHDRAGCRVRFEYDEHNNISSETSARGATTTYRYNALGRAIEERDSLGRVCRARFDGAGQLVEVDRPDGTRVQATYDRLGNTASATDALGRVTRMDYIGSGRLGRLVRPDGEAFRFVYDSDERLVRVINPRLETHEFEYNRANQITHERTFDKQLIAYRYSRAGNVTRIDYPEGEWREFGYDKLGNVVEDRAEDVQITFARDALGRIAQAVCKDVTGKTTTEFERDRFGRILADIQNGRAVRYEYDAVERTARILPDGERTEYLLGPDGHLDGVLHEGHRMAIERDALGRERSRTLAEWRQERDYDAMDRMVAQRTFAPKAGSGTPKVLAERRYGYDAGGRLLSIESPHDGVMMYRYDRIDQLIEATSRGVREVFRYDPTGSLVGALSELLPENHELWTVATGNRLEMANGVKYVNDGRGRRIGRIEPSPGSANGSTGGKRVTTYGWDSHNRLREIVTPEGSRVRFTYDALGRRARKDVLPPSDFAAGLGDGVANAPPPRATTEFLWDGFLLCEERDTSNTKPRKRIHVHERGSLIPILQAEQGRVFGVLTDHLGTPKELVDQAGRVVWRARHGVWGNLLGATREGGDFEVESPFRLLGQYADKETGLSHTLNRYFEADTGRWLSTDPIGLSGGPNLSAFGGSPTLAVDAYGLETILATSPAYMEPGDLMVAMSKPSTKASLIPPDDRYHNPGTHDPKGGENPYNPTKSVIPPDHVELFKKSVPIKDPVSGKVVRWVKVGEGRDAVTHRFDGANGLWHWNGSTNGRTLAGAPRVIDPRDIPPCMRP